MRRRARGNPPLEEYVMKAKVRFAKLRVSRDKLTAYIFNCLEIRGYKPGTSHYLILRHRDLNPYGVTFHIKGRKNLKPDTIWRKAIRAYPSMLD
jgi:hypothetical protein